MVGDIGQLRLDDGIRRMDSIDVAPSMNAYVILLLAAAAAAAVIPSLTYFPDVMAEAALVSAVEVVVVMMTVMKLLLLLVYWHYYLLMNMELMLDPESAQQLDFGRIILWNRMERDRLHRNVNLLIAAVKAGLNQFQMNGLIPFAFGTEAVADVAGIVWNHFVFVHRSHLHWIHWKQMMVHQDSMWFPLLPLIGIALAEIQTKKKFSHKMQNIYVIKWDTERLLETSFGKLSTHKYLYLFIYVCV